MYRFFPRYYHPIRWDYYRPYNHCFGYQCLPYNYFINSQIAQSNQDIYNSGYMQDVIQQSIISQSHNPIEEHNSPAENNPPAVIVGHPWS